MRAPLFKKETCVKMYENENMIVTAKNSIRRQSKKNEEEKGATEGQVGQVEERSEEQSTKERKRGEGRRTKARGR